ncbi:MAG: hypothetical protein MUF10_19380 [Thermoanaerobaculaceae bacterium]|nr:hypothetical protein [Thermoanaerobaculaceae bacterium]
MEANGSRIAKLVVLVLVAALSAACATTRYTQSRIETAPGAPKVRAGEAVTVELEGLKVRVGSLDRAPRGEAIPALALGLAFEPEALGYSFDPAQVVLRTADGRELRPLQAGCRLLSPGDSLTLEFDAAVEAGQTLDLVLGGLFRGPRRLEPVTLRLARHDGRSYDRLYWLEAIGVVLAAPLALAGGGY